LASGGWRLIPQTPLPHAILPELTVLLQNVLSLSPFLMKALDEGFKEKILVKTFFWRAHYTFGNILF